VRSAPCFSDTATTQKRREREHSVKRGERERDNIQAFFVWDFGRRRIGFNLTMREQLRLGMETTSYFFI
jgi:hypothetical protein